MIGAGSVVFSKNLTGDILSFPEFQDATFSYMDIDKERLEVGAALCKRLAKAISFSNVRCIITVCAFASSGFSADFLACRVRMNRAWFAQLWK